MKNFLIKIGTVIFSAIFIFLLVNVAYYKAADHSRLVAFEVYSALEVSGQKTEYSGLVLGDSVARQIFNPDYQQEDEKLCYLTTNQAITPAGNYILLQNFLQNNPQTQRVYYVARPDSLQNEINFIYTYSYFVTPLYREPYSQYLEPETREEIERVFGTFFAKKEFAKWMMAKYPKLLEMYNNSLNEIWHRINESQDKEFADVSVNYIAKMQQLCHEHDIEFILLPAPVPIGYDEDEINGLENEMSFYGLSLIFENYKSNILYVNDDYFVDGVHLSAEYLEENREKIRKGFLTL